MKLMVKVDHPLTYFHFPHMSDLQFVNGQLVDASLTAPTFTISDWLSVCAVTLT